MVDERSVDEYLGFASTSRAKRRPEQQSEEPTPDDGAYEDSWYQVLKAKADEDESA